MSVVKNCIYPSEEELYLRSDKTSAKIFREMKERIILNEEPFEDVISELKVKKNGFREAFNLFMRFYTKEDILPLPEPINHVKKGKSQTVEELKSFGTIDFIIDPLIPEESISILCGDAGLGKSFLSLFLGFMVAEKEEFLSYKINNKKVLFVDLESSLPLLNTRVQSIGIESDNIFFYTEGLDLLKERSLENLEKEIIYRQAGFCIIDSLMDCIPGINENDSGSMNQLFSGLRTIVKNTGCSFLLIHHVNKGEGSYRGSSAIKGAVDALYTLRTIKERVFGKILQLEPTKTRYTAIHPIKIKIEWENEKFLAYKYSDAEEGIDKAIEASEKYSDITKIMEEVKGAFFDEIKERLKEFSGNSRNSTLYKKIDNLVTEGYIKKEKKGKKNFYSLIRK